MPIVAKKTTYELPPQGFHVGTIADVVDLGEITNRSGVKNYQVRIVWFLASKDSQGKQYRTMSQVSLKLHEKSNLYSIVKGVTGVAPRVAEFDVESLLGKSNKLYLEYNEAPDGRVFANIKLITPLEATDVPATIPPDFVRECNRPPQQRQQARPATNRTQPAATATAATAAAVADEDIPF